MRAQFKRAAHHIRRWTRLTAILIACSTAGCQTTAPTTETAQSKKGRTWFLDSTASWRGADAAYSVPLANDRVLWLFGDTWIARPGSLGRRNARLIRNTIAIQHPDNPRPGDFLFYWGREESGGASLQAAPFFTSHDERTWLWPLDGVRLGPKLILFMSELKEGGGLGFESAGNIVLTVENPGALPTDWRTHRIQIPFYRTTEQGDRIFGLSVEQYGAYVYVYGVIEDWRRGPGGRSVIVARVTPEALVAEDFGAWRFYDGNGWSTQVDAAESLFADAAAEMSVHYDEDFARFVAVYTKYGWSEAIMLRTAESPEGPWSPAKTIYKCPEVERNPDYFCYAAKAHPELATQPGELVVTYAVNSTDFEDHFRDPNLYWPEVIRMNASEILKR